MAKRKNTNRNKSAAKRKAIQDATILPLLYFYEDHFTWQKAVAVLLDILVLAIAIFVFPPVSKIAAIFYGTLTPLLILGNMKAFNLLCFRSKNILDYEDLGAPSPTSDSQRQSTTVIAQTPEFTLQSAPSPPKPPHSTPRPIPSHPKTPTPPTTRNPTHQENDENQKYVVTPGGTRYEII